MGEDGGTDSATAAEGPAAASDPEAGSVDEPGPPRQAAPTDSFGWRGWVLVGTIVVAFLVVPAAILALPATRGIIAGFGLTLRDAYLVLPLPAAILLGAVAVWAALSSRRAD